MVRPLVPRPGVPPLRGDATREPDRTARNDAADLGGHPGSMPLTIEALAQ
jgi:hypothetical protein